MKLVFPNGEHPQMLLAPGVNRIGADAGANIVLRVPDMPDAAAELHVLGERVQLLPVAGADIAVNDAPVAEMIALRTGDRLRIAGVEARLAALAAVPDGLAERATPLSDPATRVLATVPRFMLRRLNGDEFGKLYPVASTLVLGRAPECDIVMNSPEISRRHAQVRPTPEGVMVEDLGSGNGVWINDKRVAQGLLRPGDELRLHTARYVLSVPGQDLPAARPQAMPTPAPGARRGRILAAAIIAVLVALTIAVLVKYAG